MSQNPDYVFTRRILFILSLELILISFTKLCNSLFLENRLVHSAQGGINRLNKHIFA